MPTVGIAAWPSERRAEKGRWMQRVSRPVKAAAIALVAGLCVSRPVLALDPGRAITQYVHESWIVKDGAPAGTITGITQGGGGYLWLGTEGEGLVRFDGVSFRRETALDQLFGRRVDRVTSLISGRDGALWVGTNLGLARFRKGVWAAFDRGEAKDVFGLHEAADGAIWYARHWEGVYRVAGETVAALPLAAKPRFLASDENGTLWAGGYEGLWRLAGKDRRLYGNRDGLRDPNVQHVYADPSGNVWLGLQVGLTQLRGDRLVAHFDSRDGLSSDDVTAVYVDGDGILWVGTATGGLNRRRAGRFESMNKALGLTNDRVTAMYEDREGSLWIGTSGGLNRLREANLLPIGAPEGLSRKEALSAVAGPDGTVFVSTGFGGVNAIKGDRIQVSPPTTVPGLSFDGALFADADGSVWSGHRGGLAHRRGGRGVRYEVGVQVTGISRDAESLVFSASSGEIYRLRQGRPERYRLADGSLLGPETFGFDYVWMMFVSRDGTLWLATSRGAIAVRDGRARVAWARGTLSARSVSEDEAGNTWIATMAGLVRIAGDSVAIVTTAEGLPQDDIYHALSDGRGGIWMSGTRGVFRSLRQELIDVAEGRAGTAHTELFGAADGMRTSEAAFGHQPAGCVTPDGRVWFATTEGMVVADPGDIKRNTLPPPVVVEGVDADDRTLASSPVLQVPVGTERLTIRYNGLSLLVPQRVRFRYKLEGYDRDWVDAETRRVAYYTKLPPGSYRFRVSAANNDGVWNEAGASLDLRQLPHFYQTRWFALLCAVAALAAVAGAHGYRVRRHLRLEGQLQARIQEALAEINTLSGLLPICAWCKKVREDGGYWSQIETYVSERSQAEFTHGICPDCLAGQARSQATATHDRQ